MTIQTRLIVIGLLILATSLEVTGDALVRIGIGRNVADVKGAYFLAGAALLFGYGFTLNTAPLEFHKVVGIYIAILFIVWQIISFLVFRSTPTVPILVGGALIVAGGLIVAFWTSATA
jgi:small multidrug resistance family-3 protein